MFERSFTSNDIIGLLTKLKLRTPDYPSDLMAIRKAAFLKQAITIKFEGPKQGGKGGGDGGSLSSGSSGSGALGGMSAAQTVLLQAVIGVWIIAAMLTAAYVFRDQIIALLQDYDIVSVEMTQVPSIDSSAPAIESPVIEIPSPDASSTVDTSPSATALPDASVEGETVSDPATGEQETSEPSDNTKDNPGLHLGQTPGAPDTPNQEPDKPEKPDKPGKPK